MGDVRIQCPPLGETITVQDVLKLEYKYDTNGTSYDNNGSLPEQKITVPGIEDPFIQTYTYDDLNRLASATETNDSVQTWKQTFTIDRYGNRKFNTSGSNTTTLGSCPAAECRRDRTASPGGVLALRPGLKASVVFSGA
ncbi:MAG: hypothetical protein IPM25_03470 [Chloracidobacterium sp.]|nr:hypothetical protein [Chloracidobacterium sp.]